MNDDSLMAYLLYLKLSYFREYHQFLAKEASEKNWTQLDFLSRLVEGETLRRKDRATKRRIQVSVSAIIDVECFRVNEGMGTDVAGGNEIGGRCPPSPLGFTAFSLAPAG